MRCQHYLYVPGRADGRAIRIYYYYYTHANEYENKTNMLTFEMHTTSFCLQVLAKTLYTHRRDQRSYCDKILYGS
jgi:hypothetical protein